MQKIKTVIFWKAFLYMAILFLILSLLLDHFVFKNFGENAWKKRIVISIVFGLFMAFRAKPKSKPVSDINEVK